MRLWVAIVVASLGIPAGASAGTVFLLDGRGWGHGVGMSQWGAEGYARHGFDYRAILAHYYPHTHIGLVSDREVRVLLAQGQDRVRVGSDAPFLAVDAMGQRLHIPARDVVLDRRVLLQRKHLAPPVRFVAGAQPLRVDGVGYRGDVVVKAKPAGLMAVNILPLDRYLRGVVPWEAPRGWHEATYEAQAVAARSYTLATLRPTADFDLFRDQRSQMYGGVAAERTETNLALGATAGQVLVWNDTIIPAFYFASSGGRTSSVHDAWQRAQQVPYLVSVSDPYDYISPHHVWPTRVLTPQQFARTLRVNAVRDARVVDNSSGRVRSVDVLTAKGWRRFPAQVVRRRFKLGSTDFRIGAMDLDPPAAPALYGTHVNVHGWVRGLGRARLEELTDQGWQAIRRLSVNDDGHFSVSVPAVRSTQLRIAYNDIAGDAVALHVAPRLSLFASGQKLRVRVQPQLPLQVERLTRAEWRPVARSRGVFDRTLRPGSYRVAVLGGPAYTRAVSRPFSIRV